MDNNGQAVPKTDLNAGIHRIEEKRMGQLEVSDAVFVSPLSTLEDRLTEIEKTPQYPAICLACRQGSRIKKLCGRNG